MILTFDMNIYLIVLFKFEAIIFYVPPLIYILVVNILGNIEKNVIYNICNKGIWA